MYNLVAAHVARVATLLLLLLLASGAGTKACAADASSTVATRIDLAMMQVCYFVRNGVSPRNAEKSVMQLGRRPAVAAAVWLATTTGTVQAFRVAAARTQPTRESSTTALHSSLFDGLGSMAAKLNSIGMKGGPPAESPLATEPPSWEQLQADAK
jgi:hypothetical protein